MMDSREEHTLMRDGCTSALHPMLLPPQVRSPRMVCALDDAALEQMGVRTVGGRMRLRMAAAAAAARSVSGRAA